MSVHNIMFGSGSGDCASTLVAPGIFMVMHCAVALCKVPCYVGVTSTGTEASANGMRIRLCNPYGTAE